MRWINQFSMLLALVLLILDLALKQLSSQLVTNQQAVLGIGISNGVMLALHVTVLCLAFAVYAKLESITVRNSLVIAIIVSLSNLFDRLVYGGVRDYLFLGPVAFNLADLVITVVILVYIAIVIHEAYRGK